MTSPKTVALAGTSGVVGARVLHHLLAREDVGRVVAVGRRVLEVRRPKLSSEVADLCDAEAIAARLPAAVDVAISCLGTTMKQAGSKEAFRAVDHDAVLAFARAARARGARRFLAVSALGADLRSKSFYLRTKGEAEEALARMGFDSLAVVRPSLIDDEGTRKDRRPGEQLALPVARAVFAVLGRTHRYAPIRADIIARALVRLAFDGSDEPRRTIESDALHRLGG